MKAAVLHGTNDLRYEDIQLDPCESDEVIVKIKAAGICGSDPPRVLRNWKYPVPAIPGHEFSGIVEEVGANVKNFKVGDRVVGIPFLPCNECEFCKRGLFSLCDNHGMLGAKSFGAFAEYTKVKATNILNIGEMDFEDAAMIEPLAVAMHGVLGIDPRIGDTVAVLGSGTLGQMVTQALKVAGVGKVIAIDISENKLREAESLGADVLINAKEVNVIDKVMELTEGKGVDIALECAGSKVTQEQCLLITKKKGKIGYLGIAYSDIHISEEAFENIFRKELELKGFWNSYSAPFPGQEWTKSIQLVNEGKIKLKDMVSHRFGLQDAYKAFEMIRDRKEEFNKILIIPQGDEVCESCC